MAVQKSHVRPSSESDREAGYKHSDSLPLEETSAHHDSAAPERASSATRLRRYADIIHLQRSIGNNATATRLSKTLIDTHIAPSSINRTEHIGRAAPPNRIQTQHIHRDPTLGADPNSPEAVLQRVQTALLPNNLSALITIQQELLQQMQTDPLHPPAGARVGLSTARHWTMDQIAAIRDTYTARLEAARTGATAGGDATTAVEDLETSMDAECTPYLDALMKGDPQYRYEHFNTTISEKVFAAVRLHSMRRGVGRIGHRAEAEAEAREHGHLATGAWCGVFAYTQAEQGGGFDPHWAPYMQGELGIRGALAYYGETNPWIWVFDHWESIKEYHAFRGSLRWYEAINRAPPQKGIQAGDIVLIDNSFGTNPDHVTTAIAFDGRFLTTVGGNQGTDNPADEKGVSRSARGFDLQSNPQPKDVTDKDAKDADGKPIRREKEKKSARVHGVGRWSVVDYERHLYSTTKPVGPPSAEDLAKLG